MNISKLQSTNNAILSLLLEDCRHDTNAACITYSLPRNTVEVIAKLTEDKIQKIGNSVTFLIQPCMIPVQMWEQVDKLSDDAFSTLSNTLKF